MNNEEKKTTGSARKNEKGNQEKELARIKAGLKSSAGKIAESIRHRVGAGDWKLAEMDCSIDGGKDTIDLVFSAPDGKKEKFVIIDVSIPHLGVGQKYALPGKAKLFQKEREVPVTRVKKAIVLIRKGTESISTQPSRIRCPILEIQLESIVRPEPVAAPVREENRDRNADQETHRQPKAAGSDKQGEQTREASSTGITGVSQELLFALKEAIVHECLSTMHKRCNKYIRKGLWRWIEREIMDPNVHFYLIILSSIYQGKTGEILSRRFKTAESYSSTPEEVISALFSKENNLADEIKKSAERHKKALNKFLACFSQTPPFEYLKSIFLKDFRSNGDGLKARMTVYSTLAQLLERCGVEGEKETQYPLEILDELKVFQGIMTGNYSTLRTDNASKKLKHLVPQVDWSNEDIYQLRNQLARALNLPAQEFNLNAFLPQAFFHDARHMAESRKEAVRAPINSNQNRQSAPAPAREKFPPRERHQNDRRPQRQNAEQEITQPMAEERPANEPAQQMQPPKKNHQSPRDSELAPPKKNHGRNYNQQQPQMAANDDEQTSMRPVNVEPMLENQNADPDNSFIERAFKRHFDLDESQHRYFEYFGGQTEEDIDAVKLALAMVRHRNEAQDKAAARSIPEPIPEPDQDQDFPEGMPLKTAPNQTFVHMNPPKKHAHNMNSGNGQPGAARTDRKRRFSRNSPRNKTRRNNPGNGINR